MRFAATILLLLALPLSAETWVHAGGAFALDPPAGWTHHALVNAMGHPAHVFTPDGGSGPWARGMWVFFLPVPPGSELAGDSLAVASAGYVLASEPELRVALESRQVVPIAGGKGIRVPVSGRRAGVGDWRGELLVVPGDPVLAICHGGPPAEFEALRARTEAALRTLVSPVSCAPLGEPPMPAATERVRDVVARFKASVPIVDILFRDETETESLIDVGATGSAFAVHPEGYLVTNRHVVEGSPAKEGRHGGRRTYDPVRLAWDETTGQAPCLADVVAVSWRWDLALLRIRGERTDWPCFPLASIEKAEAGDKVLILGWPDPSTFGRSALNVNEGTLSAIERDPRRQASLLRHSAKTTSGNSGGPLYDLDLGALVGAHNAGILVNTKGVDEWFYHEAVPVGRILEEFPQITDRARRRPVDAAERGALIAYYALVQRIGAAMAECRRALAEDPADGVANAFAFYMSEGDPERARPHLERALARPESRAIAILAAGRAHIEEGDAAAALEAAAEAIRLHHELPDGYLVAGHACMQQGRFADALARFRDASRVVRGLSAEAETMQAAALLMEWIDRNPVPRLPAGTAPGAGLAAEARRHLERSLALWPFQNGISHAWLGILAALSGQERQAVDHLDASLDASPEDPGVRVLVAWYHLLRGEHVLALNRLRGLGGLAGSGIVYFLRSSAYAGLAEALRTSGDEKEAQECVDKAGLQVQRALLHEPNARWAADAYCIYGWYLFECQDYDTAKAAFRKALQVRPGHPLATEALRAMGG